MKRLLDGWERFWFTPTETSTLAVVRVAYGLVVLGFTLSLGPDLMAFFSRTGVLPRQPGGRWIVGLLGSFGGDAAVITLYVLLLIASVCLLVGYRTRLAAAVVFIGVLSFSRRNPFILNSGDALIRLLALYLMLAPSGVALSLDRWKRARERFWEFPPRAPWALRLIQIQISVVYLATVWAKVRGTSWNNGTAVSYALRLGDLVRFPVPRALTESALAMNVVTYGTLAIELALGILIWNRRARPWVIGLGILLHLSIDLTIMVGFFSFAIYVGYLAFVPPERMTALLLALRQRMEGARFAVVRRLAEAQPEPQPVTAPAVSAPEAGRGVPLLNGRRRARSLDQRDR